MRILTFNWHVPYLCLLARLPHQLLVVEPEIAPGKLKHWDRSQRPLPGNARRLSPDEAAEVLAAGGADLAIAHNIKDLVWLHPWSLPKIIVFHNRLTTEIALGQNRVERGAYLSSIAPLLDGVTRVFISQSKRRDWGMEGRIILPGIDCDLFNGYTGERPLGLRVGNHFRERNLMLGFDASEKIAAGFPIETLGLNPTLPASRPASGLADLKAHYRQCRFYLHTTVGAYEDGYNLALLEAMATGMPVVATANPTSPVENGVSGFVSGDVHPLREGVARLLGDRALAHRLGKNAREAVRARFSLHNFIDAWNETIETAAARIAPSPAPPSQATEIASDGKLNVLMDYVSCPITTARYLERGLRKICRVVTMGGSISPDILRKWNLMPLADRVTRQDIVSEPGAPLKTTLDRLPAGFTPDVYLWVETGLAGPPPDLSGIALPKACYLIDSHLHFDRHREIAREFDWVFVAQKAYVRRFLAAGCKRVSWLPLACDGEIHAAASTDKTCDVGFAGTVSPAHRRRAQLLKDIGGHFHLKAERRFLEDMAALYAESRIVFNNAIDGDLNMRVFEAMASGSLLVTDRVPEAGLDDLFEAGRHFAYYEDENLLQTVRHYLDDSEARERIAAEGRRHVLAHHTYGHRARALIEAIRPRVAVRAAPEGTGAAPAKPQASHATPPAAMPEAGSQAPAVTAYHRNIRRDVMPLIPDDALVVLEVGCGAGATGAELKKTRGRFVAGIELDKQAAEAARAVLDDVIEGDIEALDLPYRPGSFDCLLLADVLEHLVDPLAVLRKLKPLLRPGGTVVASLPNVQYFGLLNHLVEGNWTYQAEGILDRTHLRFFTFREIEKLFKDAGFAITGTRENLNPEFERAQAAGGSAFSVGRLTVSGLTPEEMRRFFVFQYIVAARLEPPARPEKARTAQVVRAEAKPAAAPAGRMQEALPSREAEGFRSPAALKQKKIDDAKALEASGRHLEAARLFSQVASLFPECGRTRLQAALAFQRAEEPAQAIATLDEFIARQPANLDILLAAGRLHIVLGNPGRAIDTFMQALGHAPEDGRVLMGLGRAYEEKRLLAEACYCYLKALAAQAGDAEKRLLALLPEKPRGAAALIERLLSEQPGDPALLRLSRLVAGESEPAVKNASPSRPAIGSLRVNLPGVLSRG